MVTNASVLAQTPAGKFTLPKDTARHYALGLMPKQQNAWSSALYTIADSLVSSATEPLEHTVTQAKLVWWQSEIKHMFDKQPTHPATQALCNAQAAFELLRPNLWEQLCTGAQTMSTQNRHLDLASLERQAAQIQGSIMGQIAAWLGASELGIQAAQKLGSACALKHYISHLGYYARLGRIEIPMDELSRFGVTINDILRFEAPVGYNEPLLQLLEYQRARALTSLQSAIQAIPATDKRLLHPLLVHRRLDTAWLNALPKQQYPILHQHLMLNPLKAWWISLTTRT